MELLGQLIDGALETALAVAVGVLFAHHRSHQTNIGSLSIDRHRLNRYM